MKLLRLTSRETRVEFCDRCGKVCDARCRSNAVHERALTRSLDGRLGVR